MTPVIIGSQDDPHVRAVVDALPTQPTVLDVETLRSATFEFSPPDIRIRAAVQELNLASPTRGWLRRIAPMSWESGTTIGSHKAVTKASWLALLAALLRHPDVRWISDVDAITAAENKLTQYTTAARLGIPMPRTLVSNSLSALNTLGSELVAKPLGPGHFQNEDGSWLTVFTEAFDPSNHQHAELIAGPPFIVQERIVPTAHLRVTTVQDKAWIFRLPAAGLPIDWREVPAGHENWIRIRDHSVGHLAVRLARANKVGYSSQDWIEAGDATVFVDLNPSGQWLFLPAPGADEITATIAAWLAESCA